MITWEEKKHLVATVDLHDYEAALIAMIPLPTLEPSGPQNSLLELQKRPYPLSDLITILI